MAAETETTPSQTVLPAPAANYPSSNSDAEFAKLLAHIERRKNDQQYFESWDAQAAEYKKQQEQVKRG